MIPLQYNIKSYIAFLKFTENIVLLVEGKDDKDFFDMVIEATEVPIDRVNIQDARIIMGESEIMGNRQKVECICKESEKYGVSMKIVGFVDREFRGFNFETGILDTIVGHHQENRLIWSRGHSIENYLFEFKILRTPLFDAFNSSTKKMALRDLEENFYQVLQLACTISLTGTETESASILRDSVSWDTIIIDKEKVSLDFSKIQTSLIRKNLQTEKIAKILERYNYWKSLVEHSDITTLRWLCHGHIGMAILIASFARFVYENSLLEGENYATYEANKSMECKHQFFLKLCIRSWLGSSFFNSEGFPEIVLNMLRN